MVDYDPWQGNFTDTVVRNNRIVGGFATDQEDDENSGQTLGTNNETVIIK